MDEDELTEKMKSCYNSIAKVLNSSGLGNVLKVAVLESIKLDIFNSKMYVADSKIEGLDHKEATKRKQKIQ